MFDQYQIKKVEWKVQMMSNPDAARKMNEYSSEKLTENQSKFYPKLWYTRDYDGGIADTLSQVKERTNAKFFVMRPSKEYKITLKPKVLVQTYKATLKALTSAGYAPEKFCRLCARGHVCRL
jgi:hypothetical protein